MKISIELEIQPDEVQLATELLSTLRALTEHVRAAPPTVKNVKLLFVQLLSRLADEAHLDQVASQIASAFNDSSFGGADDLLRAFLDAFDQVVLKNVDLVVKHQSVVPYMKIVPKLPNPYMTQVRNQLIERVLTHLTEKRPIATERTQFFLHAEAFAVLVNFELVSVDGAAKTIVKMLGKTENRSAAITMLGKTVELCSDKLLLASNASHLASLWSALEKVTEELFKYDVEWITSHLSSLAAAQSGLSASPASGLAYSASATLTGVTSFVGHAKDIFAMCYDAAHSHLISGGKDSSVLVWGENGEIVHRIDSPTHYVCSMDVHPRHSLLLLCSVAAGEQPTRVPMHPFIALYDTNNNWQSRAVLSKAQCTLISCLRCMGGGSDGFVTGETRAAAGGNGLQEVVAYYDLGGLAGADLTPVHSYQEHENLVTCVATRADDPHTFVSGSRDNTIRLWDRRTDKSVGICGLLDSTSFTPRAHDEMVTCVDARGDLLLSSAVDGYLGIWDIRRFGASGCAPLTRLSLDGQPALKVAITGSPVPHLAAASTFNGLYLLDLTNPAMPVVTAAVPLATGRPVQHYHDIKWAHKKPLVYAGGESLTVDVFQLA